MTKISDVKLSKRGAKQISKQLKLKFKQNMQSKLLNSQLNYLEIINNKQIKQ